jgi:AraC-like DNA-binding protein
LAQQFYGEDETIGNYSMNNLMDRQLMKNVEQYVIQNMSRGQISLEEMASAMGMGRVPFFHKIRSITTKTPAEIVREIRLKHACTLLTQTNINMSELAINVGFNTAENFINIFKDKFGMTPLEYRLKNKK